jgi:hypothetical protein
MRHRRQRKEPAAAHQRGVDLFVSVPSSDAALRAKDSGEQLADPCPHAI